MSKRIRWCVKKEFNLERFGELLKPSLDSGHLTNDGPLQKPTQNLIAKLTQSQRQVLLCASGTAALHTLVAMWNRHEKTTLRWLTQAFTFPSAIQGPLKDAIVVDIDLERFGPDVQVMEKRIDEFDGFIVTNVFGFQTNIKFYHDWAKKHNKILLFDNAATPVGFVLAGEKKKCIHDFGHGAFISLHETKPIGRGEGGAIFVDESMTTWAHQAMNFGFDVKNNVRIGDPNCSNWRMSDFAAAAIFEHLERVIDEDWVGKSSKLMQSVEDVLNFPIKPAYPSIFSCLFISKPLLFLFLDEAEIEFKHYYRPLADKDTVPNAWHLFESTVCVPFHTTMTPATLEFLINKVKK